MADVAEYIAEDLVWGGPGMWESTPSDLNDEQLRSFQEAVKILSLMVAFIGAQQCGLLMPWNDIAPIGSLVWKLWVAADILLATLAYFWVARQWRNPILDRVGWRWPKMGFFVLARRCVIGGVGLGLAQGAVVMILSHVTANAGSDFNSAVRQSSVNRELTAITTAPIAEELEYRGSMLFCLWLIERARRNRKLGTWTALALQATVFAGQAFLFGWGHKQYPVSFRVVMMMVGLGFGWLAWWTGSCWASAIAHMFMNVLAAIS